MHAVSQLTAWRSAWSAVGSASLPETRRLISFLEYELCGGPWGKTSVMRVRGPPHHRDARKLKFGTGDKLSGDDTIDATITRILGLKLLGTSWLFSPSPH